MAATNGYKPEQASDLYISSGTTRDYEYGVYRIFSYTFEMSLGAYKDDSLIASETGRNKEAVLYLIERAWCPLAVLGRHGPARRAAAPSTTTSRSPAAGRSTPTGPTRRRPRHGSRAATPAPDVESGPKQVRNTATGIRSLVTGLAAGASANANDLDGRTTARSPAIDAARRSPASG